MVWLRDPKHAPNLDEILNNLGLGQEPENLLFWAAIHKLPLPGWDPPERLICRGTGWIVIMDFDDHRYVEIDEHTRKPVPVDVRPPSMLIGVKMTELNAAGLTVARARLNALTGALATRIDPRILAWRVYENFVEVLPNGRIRYAASRQGVEWKSDKDDLQNRINSLEKLDLDSATSYANRGAEWLAKAIEQDGLEAKFTCLWLSILAIIDGWAAETLEPPTGNDGRCCTTSGDWPVRRKMREYIRQRLNLSGNDENSLFSRLDDCYSLRHRLLKGARSDIVEEEIVVSTADLASRFVTREFALA